MITFADFILKVLPLLMDKTVDRLDRECVEGKVTAYWAGSVLRIDLKPRDGK